MKLESRDVQVKALSRGHSPVDFTNARPPSAPDPSPDTMIL
jgi:hypothetical protein